MEPEIYENRSLPYFFTTKKTTKFQQHFFLDVPAFREARTLKIKPNHCRVDQKRGYHRFLEKRKLFKKISKSDPPMDPPEAINSVKSRSRPRQKKLQKKEKKNAQEACKPGQATKRKEHRTGKEYPRRFRGGGREQKQKRNKSEAKQKQEQRKQTQTQKAEAQAEKKNKAKKKQKHEQLRDNKKKSLGMVDTSAAIYEYL